MSPFPETLLALKDNFPRRRDLEENLTASIQPSQQETMPLPHRFQSSQLMGNWSRLERNPVQRYQGWEGGVNSGRDASEVKPLIMITNWSWLLERQAAAVDRSAFEVPPACWRVPGPLAWGDAGTMWLPVGKNVMRRQGDGAQDGWRVDGSTGPAGGPADRTPGTTGDGTVGMREWENKAVWCCGWFLWLHTCKQGETFYKLLATTDADCDCTIIYNLLLYFI